MLARDQQQRNENIGLPSSSKPLPSWATGAKKFHVKVYGKDGEEREEWWRMVELQVDKKNEKNVNHQTKEKSRKII